VQTSWPQTIRLQRPIRCVSSCGSPEISGWVKSPTNSGWETICPCRHGFCYLKAASGRCKRPGKRGSEVRSQKSEVRSQKSEVRSQESGIGTQYSVLVGHYADFNHTVTNLSPLPNCLFGIAHSAIFTPDS